MGFGHIGSLGAGFGWRSSNKSAASFAPNPAPSGFHWEFVTNDADGSRITDDATGQPVVDLMVN